MTWVEVDLPGWVDEHVHAVVNIAGTSLGVPKSISALLSGG
jgi:phospholipid:diacylglycerol acyltransferase